MNYTTTIENAARSRIAGKIGDIRRALDLAKQGCPLAAEDNPDRLKNRLQTKLRISERDAELMTRAIQRRPGGEAMAEVRAAVTDRAAGPEAIWGDTLDFVGVAFLQRGLRAAKSVARVAFNDGRPQGSGFLISDRLFITNNHVIGSAAETRNFCLEFDYEADTAGRPVVPTRFEIDPVACFITDERDDLDYTVFAVGKKISGPNTLGDYGFCPLSGAGNKHALGEVANIVQHPDGRLKEVVLRENRLTARLDTVLHYVADTEPGASGSPVFNNEWQAIALHHWGGPWRQQVDDNGQPLNQDVNEGIRISAIVQELGERLGELRPEGRALVEAALAMGESTVGPAPARDSEKTPKNACGWRVEADGRMTWRLPIEISVRMPGVGDDTAVSPSPAAPVSALDAAPARARTEAIKPDTDFSDRSGYKPNFINGFTVPLPKLGAAVKNDAAPNIEAEAGDDPNELKYHHFSVVMNAKRKLAFFTACNIDGSKAKKVDRKTGTVSVLRADDPGLESLMESGGAEASETWFAEPRLAKEHQTPLDQYAGQKVPGFPTSNDPRRLPRMFQRGHLVRRMDPAWGSNSLALRADADTFHVTNCSPQIGFFNMGTARPLNLPNTERGALWRAIENYVLRNAVDEKKRICCFTGPVLNANDPAWRGIHIPLKFWKIVVWPNGNKLHALAMIADQEPVLDTLAGLPEDASSAEAFAALGKVDDFLTTVAKVEALTNLNFGTAVRNADVRAGQESVRHVERWDAIPLSSGKVPKSRAKIGGHQFGLTQDPTLAGKLYVTPPKEEQ